MQVFDMLLNDIKPYDRNPRINDRAVEVVADSIREFGFKNPIIVDKDNVIVAGHTRYRASIRLGLEKVPVIVADDLTDEQVQAFRIMDNKSSEYAEWDYEMLLEEINELKSEGYDTFLTGFSELEVEDLLDKMADDIAKEEQKKVKPQLEFTQELLEEHQYVVFYVDNTLDWQVIKDHFGLGSVHALASREGFEKVGTGRVVNGKVLVDMIKQGDDEQGGLY